MSATLGSDVLPKPGAAPAGANSGRGSKHTHAPRRVTPLRVQPDPSPSSSMDLSPAPRTPDVSSSPSSGQARFSDHSPSHRRSRRTPAATQDRKTQDVCDRRGTEPPAPVNLPPWMLFFLPRLAKRADVQRFGVARVTVVRGDRLKASDFSMFGKATSDPYCMVTVGGHSDKTTCKTRTIPATLNPTWNQQFDFPLKYPWSTLKVRGKVVMANNTYCFLRFDVFLLLRLTCGVPRTA